MARIFVSSTFKDLEECREKVRLTLRRMGHEDVSMEYFVAEDKRPVDKCLEAVASSDLYVGIFAWRYGYRPPGHDRSITELEYRKAVEFGKSCLLFLLHEDAPWPRKLMDKGEDASNIEELRGEFSTNFIVSFFESPEDLAGKVGTAVHNWEKENYTSVPESGRITELELKQYKEAVSKRYCNIDLDALTPSKKEDFLKVQLSGVFVEQNVRENPPPVELPKEIWKKLHEEWDPEKECFPEGLTAEDLKRAKESYYSKDSKAVLDVISDERNKYIVILGDPGAGKSTLTKYIILSVLQINNDEKLSGLFNSYLPLRVELRKFAGLCAEKECKTFLDYFQYLSETEGYSLTKEEIDNYLKNDGKAIIIFDGLDEIFDPKDWEQINYMIVGFTLDYPKIKIIVTSRIVGYKRKILDDAGFVHFTLQDFEKEQIETFLDRWYPCVIDETEIESRKSRILKALKDSSSIRQLAGNPLLLTILAIIGKHQELPRERWKLYDHAASVLVENWEVNKHLKKSSVDMDFIGEDDKKDLLMKIAFKMQSGPGGLAGNFIHRNILQKEIESYLQKRYQKNPSEAKLIAKLIIEQLWERNFILCLYGADFYGFVHRTFLEYFCAMDIVKKFDNHELNIETLKLDYFEKYWEDPTWHEVLSLVCGMKEKFADEIIECLMQVYNPQYFGSRPPLNISLAIKCLSEIRNPNAIEKTAKKLLEKVLRLFEMVRWTQDIKEFLIEEIVPAAKMVGSSWPHRDLIVYQFSRTQVYMNYYFFVDSYIDPDIDFDLNTAWAEFVAEISSNSEVLYTLLLNKIKNEGHSRFLAVLTACKYAPKNSQFFSIFLDVSKKDKNSDIRRIALSELARSWRDDPETLNIIKRLAKTDEEGNVRSAAIFALARSWRDDPETLNIIKQATTDVNWFVKFIAVQELARGWHDDPETLNIIKQLTMTDKEINIRITAIQELARGWHDDPETQSTIKKFAKTNKFGYARSIAIQELARGWHDDPDTLNLIKKFAKIGEDWSLRSDAIQELARGWHDDPETLNIIKELVTNDKTDYIRNVAIHELARGWHDDPETLNIIKKCAATDKSMDGTVAVKELARGWHDDPETLNIIKEFARTNESRYGKSTAIHELAHGWHDDPDTLNLIKKFAKIGEDWSLRSIAIHELARGWHDDPETLNIIKELANSGKVRDLRSDAIQVLARGWHDDPEVLNIIKKCATTDKAGYVRSVAIQELARGWHDDPDTLNIIQHATIDKANNVRTAAVQELIHGWHCNTETLNIIKHIIATDKSLDVRDTAAQELNEWWNEEVEKQIEENALSEDLTIHLT